MMVLVALGAFTLLRLALPSLGVPVSALLAAVVSVALVRLLLLYLRRPSA